MRRAVFALPLLALLSTGCRTKATPKECDEMLERYIDMVMWTDPELANLPEAQKSAAREMKKAIKKSEPGYRKVQEQDRKSTRLNSSHLKLSRMPSSA